MQISHPGISLSVAGMDNSLESSYCDFHVFDSRRNNWIRDTLIVIKMVVGEYRKRKDTIHNGNGLKSGTG